MRPLLLLVVVVAALVAWRFLPSLLQKAGPLVSAACGSSERVGGAAGTDFSIGCAPVAPKVDGSFDDWRSIPLHDIAATVTPSRDRQPGLRGQWQALWDAEGLYVHFVVTDDNLRPVENPPSAWYQGDGVSFEVGPDPRKLGARAGLRPSEDFHVILGLLPDDDRGAAAAINQVGTARDGSFVFVKGKARPEILVARRATADGYELEAKVLWSSIGRELAPERGTVLGVNFNISDAFPTPHPWALRSMMSSNPDRSAANQNHPGTWQTAALSDAS